MDSTTTVVLRYRDGRTEGATLIETDVDRSLRADRSHVRGLLSS